MVNPRTLRRIAGIAAGLPALVASAAFLAVFLIPGCEPEMYGGGSCMIGSYEVAPAILLSIIYGLFGFVLASVFAVAPLLVVAWILERSRGRGAA